MMVAALLVILASPRALGLSNVSPEKRSGQSTMIEHSRISLAPDVLVGKPVIRGTRLSVEFVIGLMADGWSEADILGNYSGLLMTTSSRVLPMRARYVELREGIPERSLKCAFLPTRISQARRSPLLRQVGTTSFGSG
jgi:uncharacterized protein (DUF433 family)